MGTFFAFTVLYHLLTEQVTRQASDSPVSVPMLSGLSISSVLPLVGQERDTTSSGDITNEHNVIDMFTFT